MDDQTAHKLLRKPGIWSEEKQRRSRVDWYQTVPHSVAHAQIGWERRETVRVMCSVTGLSHEKVGAFFGVRRERIRQMLERQKNKRLSPVTEYFASLGLTDGLDVKDLPVIDRLSKLASKRDWVILQ